MLKELVEQLRSLNPAYSFDISNGYTESCGAQIVGSVIEVMHDDGIEVVLRLPDYAMHWLGDVRTIWAKDLSFVFWIRYRNRDARILTDDYLVESYYWSAVGRFHIASRR